MFDQNSTHIVNILNYFYNIEFLSFDQTYLMVGIIFHGWEQVIGDDPTRLGSVTNFVEGMSTWSGSKLIRDVGMVTVRTKQEIFNWLISWAGLIEILMADRLFTWSNLSDNSLAKLDRFLASGDWKLRCLWHRQDLLLNRVQTVCHFVIFRENLTCPKMRFSFEKKCLLEEEGLETVISKTWNLLKEAPQHWDKNSFGDIFLQKKELLSQIELLEKKEESAPLSSADLDTLWASKKIPRANIPKWEDTLAQRASVIYWKKVTLTQHSSTVIANIKERKNCIAPLKHGDNLINDQEGINRVADDYFRGLIEGILLDGNPCPPSGALVRKLQQWNIISQMKNLDRQSVNFGQIKHQDRMNFLYSSARSFGWWWNQL